MGAAHGRPTDQRHGPAARTSGTDQRPGAASRTGVTDRRHGPTSRTSGTDQRHGLESRTSVTEQRHGPASRTGGTDQRHGHHMEASRKQGKCVSVGVEELRMGHEIITNGWLTDTRTRHVHTYGVTRPIRVGRGRKPTENHTEGNSMKSLATARFRVADPS